MAQLVLLQLKRTDANRNSFRCLGEKVERKKHLKRAFLPWCAARPQLLSSSAGRCCRSQISDPEETHTHTHTQSVSLACLRVVVQQLLDYLCADVIMLPQRPDDGLTPHIPNGEADVLVVHRLHVKACKSPDVKLLSSLIRMTAGEKKSLTDSWNGGDDLSQLQLVEQSGFSCSVQTHCGEKHPVRRCGGLRFYS